MKLKLISRELKLIHFAAGLAVWFLDVHVCGSHLYRLGRNPYR
jgi:hypothetical protein